MKLNGKASGGAHSCLLLIILPLYRATTRLPDDASAPTPVRSVSKPFVINIYTVPNPAAPLIAEGTTFFVAGNRYASVG